MREQRSHLTDYMLLIVLVAAVYARVLGHDFQDNWDDNWYVLYNESIRGFSWEHLKTIFTSIYQANYAPVQILSYSLDYSIWGLNAGGFLFTNIILHILNGLLLYHLFYRWHGDRLFALVASAFFLIHPLQVENVAWVSERKNLLSVFFFLLAWEGYRRYRDAAQGKGRFYYVTSVAAFLLSLMAKSTTLVLPLVLVLYDICFPEGGRRLRLKDKIPYAIAAVVFALVSMHVQTADFQGGIRKPFHGGSPVATFFTMLPVLCRYIGMLIWPAGLSAVYAPPVYTSINVTVLASAFLIAGVVWAGVCLFRTDRRLGFWFMFFWIGLLPYMQIVPIMWLMFDRYLNLSIIGVSALVAAGVVFVRGRVGVKRSVFIHVLVALWLLSLAGVSFHRAGVWRDSLTLSRDATMKSPTSAQAWGLLGDASASAGLLDEARQAYERALSIDPLDSEILAGLGDLYTATGELDKGYTLLKKLLEIKPKYVVGWASLGNNYLKRGDYGNAEKAYKRALELQPDAMQVVTLLGNLERIRGNLDLSRIYYLRVEAMGWNPPEIAYHLACVEALAGHTKESLDWLEKSLQRGFGDYGMLYQDQQLSTLRDDPRFIGLMHRYVPR